MIITVNYSHNILEEEELYVYTGDYIVLHCHASLPQLSTVKESSVMPHYSWRRPDGAVLELPTLMLGAVTKGDSGVYTCEVHFDPSSSESFLNTSDTKSASISLSITEGMYTPMLLYMHE